MWHFIKKNQRGKSDPLSDFIITPYYNVVLSGLMLKGLPFQPNSGEVIYLEDEFNEAVNDFIIKNYDDIVECFSKRNLVFIYLPKLVTPDVLQSIYAYRQPWNPATHPQPTMMLPSNYLLDFMANPFNRRYVGKPSFVRFNPFPLSAEDNPDGDVSLFDRFEFELPEPGQERTFIEFVAAEVKCRYSHKVRYSLVKGEDADSNFDSATQHLLDEVRHRINKLRDSGISDVVLRKLVFDTVPQLSHIRITEDHRIFLTDYGNAEVVMTPLVKTVYFLFLRHPEGIMFKHLVDHRDELNRIYNSIKDKKPGLLTHIFLRTPKNIEALTNPLNNSINEKCTRVKEAFLVHMHDSIASHYYITGKRGEPKRIALPPDLVIWENE